jgi:hypothetical protein
MTKPGSLAMQIIERAMAAKSDSSKEVSFHAAHYITNAFSQLVSRMKFALAFSRQGHLAFVAMLPTLGVVVICLIVFCGITRLLDVQTAPAHPHLTGFST